MIPPQFLEALKDLRSKAETCISCLEADPAAADFSERDLLDMLPTYVEGIALDASRLAARIIEYRRWSNEQRISEGVAAKLKIQQERAASGKGQGSFT